MATVTTIDRRDENFISKRIVIVFITICRLARSAEENTTDVRRCRVTHDGFEYAGPAFRTHGGLRCQYWAASAAPAAPRPIAVRDQGFPEGSARAAKNFCRNPQRSPDGPWCYTGSADLLYDECPVPICQFTGCRLTGPGVEYAGAEARSAAGDACASWRRARDAGGRRFEHARFPGGSRAGARALCRNPDGDPAGPWCLADRPASAPRDGPRRVKAYCSVPFCQPRECLAVTVSAARDESGPVYSLWTRRASELRDVATEVPPETAPPPADPAPDDEPPPPPPPALRPARAASLPPPRPPTLGETPVSSAAPTAGAAGKGDRGGPSAQPVPDDVAEAGEAAWRVEFGVRLWDAGAWAEAEARVLLSALNAPPPASGPRAAAWGAALELRLSNRNSSFVAGPVDSTNASTPGLLSGLRWTRLWVALGGGRAALGRAGDPAPLLDAPLRAPAHSPLGLALRRPAAAAASAAPPRAVALWGAPAVMWDFPRCTEACAVHATARLTFERWAALREAAAGAQLAFHVRAPRSACVELRASPLAPVPNAWVMLDDHNETWVSVQLGAGQPREVVARVHSPELLGYWRWRAFSISVLGERLEVWSGAEEVLRAFHPALRALRWFAVASDDALAHWTLFCEPAPGDAVAPALPPECAESRAARGFAGQLPLAASGRPCLPWTSPLVPAHGPAPAAPARARARARALARARNSCRNWDGGADGPYCYTRPLRGGGGGEEEGGVVKERCEPRACQSTDCRIAGTANDYSGELNLTRSGRRCQAWAARNATHKVPEKYLNDTLFADQSVINASNFCRNPSRNIGGTWCYTEDPKVKFDVCHVPDCDRPDECTAVVRGAGGGRRVFLLPEWRLRGLRFALKAWNPDAAPGEAGGAAVVLRPRADAGAGAAYLRLAIGAAANQRVELLRGNGSLALGAGGGAGAGEVVLKAKALPALVAAGRWAALWLRLASGGVQLGLQGMPQPIFEWARPARATAPPPLAPAFVEFRSLLGHPVGFAFPCSDCHIEETSTEELSKVLPVGMWSKFPKASFNNLTLYLRGKGAATLALLKAPDHGQYYSLTFNDKPNQIVFSRHGGKGKETVNLTVFQTPVMAESRWTKIFVEWTEGSLEVLVDGDAALQAQPRSPLLAYFFSVTARRAPVSWTANCQPQEIGGAAVHGGWSEWGAAECSVTCGGGRGLRRRSCTNPRPNVFGDACDGAALMEITCNHFPCGQLSPETRAWVRLSVAARGHAVRAAQGAALRVECDAEALTRARREAPAAALEWTLAGRRLPLPPPPRLRLLPSAVDVSAARPEDSGVWVCALRGAEGDGAAATVLRAVAVAVRPSAPQLRPRAAQRPWPQLPCRAAALGALFPELRVRWLRDGRLYADLGLATPAAVEYLILEKLNASHSGNWTCEVIDEDMQFTWVTNWIWIEVRPAPTILTHLMEDELTAPLFGWMKSEIVVAGALILIVILTVALVASGIFIYMRYIKL